MGMQTMEALSKVQVCKTSGTYCGLVEARGNGGVAPGQTMGPPPLGSSTHTWGGAQSTLPKGSNLTIHVMSGPRSIDIGSTVR